MTWSDAYAPHFRMCKV